MYTFWFHGKFWCLQNCFRDDRFLKNPDYFHLYILNGRKIGAWVLYNILWTIFVMNNIWTQFCLICTIIDVAPTPRLQGTWGGIPGIKVLISVTIHSLTFFCMINCARPSDLFAIYSQGGVLITNKMESYITVVTEDTAAMVLAKKNPHGKLPPCSTL